MLIRTNIYKEVEINSLKDLPKLKVIMKENNLKINKSEIARELEVDPRTVDKYLDCQHFFIQLLFGHFRNSVFYWRHII